MLNHFERFLKEILKKTKKNLKPYHITDGFNLNTLDHDKCSKVHKFLNFLYKSDVTSTINKPKPARITRKTATTIAHNLTNHFIIYNFKTVNFEPDVSDHFPLCTIIFSTEKRLFKKPIAYIDICELQIPFNAG